VSRYVYFIQAGSQGPIKIGVADDVEYRLSELQTGNAETLHIVGCVPGDGRLEKELHRRLASVRIRGEWFRSGSEIEALLAEVGGYMRADLARRTAEFSPRYTRYCSVCETPFLLGPAQDQSITECGACSEFRPLRESKADPFESPR
jgi:hypothetical protein